MGLLPDGEIIRVRRRHALIPLVVGAVLAAIGIAVCRFMLSRGDTGGFLLLWCAIWFLGSGTALASGFRRLLRPPVFALLSAQSVSFAAQRIRPIHWRNLVGVRAGLRTVTRGNKTELHARTPLILTVRDPDVLQGAWFGGATFTHVGHKLGDGTAEILLKTAGCPLTNDDLLRLLAGRAGITPDLRPADPKTATLGGVKLNQATRKQGALVYFGAACFLVFGLLFAGFGANKLLDARASRLWLSAPAEILSATLETGGSSGGRGTAIRTPLITYRYTVAGQTYTGDRAAFVYRSNSAGHYLQRFPAGKRTAAYYDPQDPARSVLVRDGYGRLWIFVAFGSVFAVTGGWLLQRLLSAHSAAAAA